MKHQRLALKGESETACCDLAEVSRKGLRFGVPRISARNACASRRQFFDLSTSAPFLIQGIMSRSLAPTSSIGCAASLARVALNEVWLTLFSSIQSRANLPPWMSARTRFISALVSAVTMRGPVTYSPYSAVLEIE